MEVNDFEILLFDATFYLYHVQKLVFIYFIYLNIFIQGKTLLAIGCGAYVPCFMSSNYIKYENTYFNNYYVQ